MKIIDTIIRLEIKSLNRLVSFNRAGSFKYRNYKKKWFEWVGVFIGWKRPPEQEKVKATFIRLMGKNQRDLDKDNLYGGSKPIRDALKRCGWIRDDSPKWLEYECIQHKADYPGTRIILERI